LLLLQSKNKLLGEASLCFFGSCERERGKILGIGVFVLLLLLSLMITGVLEVVSWVICFPGALLSEQGVGEWMDKLEGANGSEIMSVFRLEDCLGVICFFASERGGVHC
jgi:hypothetical protein